MKNILITGSNRGIGFELTRQYANDGHHVIACCRKLEQNGALHDLAANHNNVQIEKLDVTNNHEIIKLAQKLSSLPLDIVINNAGVFSGTPHRISAIDEDPSQNFGSLDAEAFANALLVNSIAPMMVSQAFLPQLKNGKERKIVVITSKMGSMTDSSGGYIVYRTSKAALNAAMHNAALDLRSEKITMVGLHPGWVKTDMGSASARLTPEESVTSLRKVIEQLTIQHTGQFLNYDGTTLPW